MAVKPWKTLNKCLARLQGLKPLTLRVIRCQQQKDNIYAASKLSNLRTVTTLMTNKSSGSYSSLFPDIYCG
eukprot:m.337586 g.337586  ORF g.337586 m.337586 type:complete len:71 (-) comp18166_c0_seq1:81-293(-)